jgi:hypothetical protein
MDQNPVPINPVWQKHRVFVFRVHDHAKTLEVVKIFRKRQRHTWAFVRVGGVNHRILVQFTDKGYAGIFDPPQFLRKVLWIWHQTRLGIDLPVINAIGRASNTEVGMPTAIFDTAQKQSSPIRQQCRARIEDAVDWVRPLSGSQNGIAWMTLQRLKVLIVHWRRTFGVTGML